MRFSLRALFVLTTLVGFWTWLAVAFFEVAFGLTLLIVVCGVVFAIGSLLIPPVFYLLYLEDKFWEFMHRNRR